MREQLILDALGSWQKLNEHINDFDEDELYLAMNTEATHDRRSHFLIRIHARYTKTRAAREREELLKVDK